MNAYQEHIKSKKWRSLTNLCRLAAGNKCQMCGTSDSIMHSHHMSYERMATEDEALDLCVLCEPCHVIYHRKHRLPPVKSASRSKRLDDLSTVLATHGVDVSYFHKNRIIIDSGWMRSLSSSQKPSEPIKQDHGKSSKFQEVTNEVIELAKLKSNIRDFMNIFRLKAPLRDGWEKSVLGKSIRKKIVNRFKKNKVSEFQRGRHKRNKLAQLVNNGKVVRI